MSSKNKTSWTQKLNVKKDLPKVVSLDEKGAKRWGGKTMVIPSPLMVDEIMKRVPEGKLITVASIRAYLAKKHACDIACPLTTGIFTWISANASEEQQLFGEPNTTPYWRTLKTRGLLNEKYPGGIKKQKQLLESEGHKVLKSGKNYIVKSWEQKEFDLFTH